MIADVIPILEGALFLVVLEALVTSGADRVGGIWSTVSNGVARIVSPSAPAIPAAATPAPDATTSSTSKGIWV